MKTTILIISAIAICMASAASETMYVPFPIAGYVFYEDGSACNNPRVNIINVNTSRTFPTMTLTSSNYYRADPTPQSDGVNVGDLLRFTVDTGTGSATLDHSITSSDIATGIFLNVTVGVGGNSVAAITSGQESIVVPGTTPAPTVTPVPQSQQKSQSHESLQESPKPESGPSPVSTRLTSPEWGTKVPGLGAVVGVAVISLAAIFYLILRRRTG